MRLALSVVVAVVLGASAALAGVVERVAETKTLRIGHRTDAPPFSYVPSQGGVAGYSVDICRAVADTLKADLKLEAIAVQYVAVTAENRFQALQEGKIDILCGPTTATLARREIVDFSLPIFVDGAGLMIRPGVVVANLSDLGTKNLAVRAGTTTERAVRASFPGAAIAAVADHRDGVAALKAGTADAYFADRTLLAYIRHTDPTAADLQIADEYLTVEPYALALPLGDNRFRLTVDKTLSRLFRSPEMKEVLKRAFGDAKLGSVVQALYRIVPMPE
jgi:polar amino acid transport system substrate-binding protein